MTRVVHASGFRLAAALLLGGGSAASPLWGQAPAVRADTVDRIVAVVGNTLILNSEVEEEFLSRYPRPEDAPPAARVPEIKRQVLQEMVDVELLYQRALSDTMVKVTEEEVTSAVDQQVRNIRQEYSSDQAFRDELRKTGFATPEEHRRWLTERQRKQLMTNTLIEVLRATQKLKAVIPTEKEMRAFWDIQKDERKRPGTISFRQIVVAPQPSPEAKARAQQLIDSLMIALRGGADFAAVAAEYSMDEGSKDQGGSIGWFRRGTNIDPRFEDVAFNLRPGTISNPVETPFGIHLIQVERVQPAEVLARHILIIPEITQSDADSARARADRVLLALKAGVQFDSLQRLYHDPMEEREIREFPTDRLLPAYVGPMTGVGAGGVSEVFVLQNPMGPLRSKFAVVRVDERREAGEFRFEDVKDNIRGTLGDQMAIRRYIDGLRAATYLEVRGT